MFDERGSLGFLIYFLVVVRPIVPTTHGKYDITNRERITVQGVRSSLTNCITSPR